MTYKEILWTPEEAEFIRQHGEISPAAASEAMSRSGINFDDIEDINERHENHRWGSDADRAYRKRAVNRAVQHMAANAAAYLPGVDRRAYYQRQALDELKAAVIAYERGARKLKEGQTTKAWTTTVDRYNRAFDRATALLIPEAEQTAAANEAIQTIREGKAS